MSISAHIRDMANRIVSLLIGTGKMSSRVINSHAAGNQGSLAIPFPFFIGILGRTNFSDQFCKRKSMDVAAHDLHCASGWSLETHVTRMKVNCKRLIFSLFRIPRKPQCYLLKEV